MRADGGKGRADGGPLDANVAAPDTGTPADASTKADAGTPDAAPAPDGGSAHDASHAALEGGAGPDVALDASLTDGGDTHDASAAPDAATDPQLPEPAPFVNGKRLKPRFLSTEDGLYEFDSLYDTLAKESCDFALAEDGALRCLPGENARGAHFLDEGCTQPILADSSCANPPSEFVRVGQDGACHRKVLFLRGAAEPMPRVIYERTRGECTAVAPHTDHYFPLSHMEPEWFVAGKTRTGEQQGRLVAEYAEGDDGSRALTAHADSELGFRCLAAHLLGEGRCAPPLTGTMLAIAWSGAPSCESDAIAIYDRCLESPPRFAVGLTFDPQTCSGHASVYELTGPELETVYAENAEGQCVEANAALWPATVQWYSVAAERDLSVFATLEPVARGGSRIVATTYAPDGLEPLYDRSLLYDRQLEVECYPQRAADGVERCLPYQTGGQDIELHYFDEACTQPFVGVQPNACVVPARYVTVDSYRGHLCGEPSSVLELSPEHTPVSTTVYQKQATGCSPQARSFAYGRTVVRELSPDELARVERITSP